MDGILMYLDELDSVNRYEDAMIMQMMADDAKLEYIEMQLQEAA